MRLPSSHAFIFGELFEKHHRASNSNGVVGTSGRNAPANPNATERYPTIFRKVFFIRSRFGATRYEKTKKCLPL